MTDTEKKKGPGRPLQENSKRDNLIIRVDTELLDRLDTVITRERNKTGYAISRSDIVRRAIIEFLERYGDNK